MLSSELLSSWGRGKREREEELLREREERERRVPLGVNTTGGNRSLVRGVIKYFTGKIKSQHAPQSDYYYNKQVSSQP